MINKQTAWYFFNVRTIRYYNKFFEQIQIIAIKN